MRFFFFMEGENTRPNGFSAQQQLFFSFIPLVLELFVFYLVSPLYCHTGTELHKFEIRVMSSAMERQLYNAVTLL